MTSQAATFKKLGLVPLPREVTFDDTMKEVTAVLRWDAKIEDGQAKTQMLIDFRHKFDKWKSKPRVYTTMSTPRQFENLLAGGFAMSTLSRFQHKETVTREELEAHFDELFKWVKRDAIPLAEIILRDVKGRVHVYPTMEKQTK